MGKQKFGSFYPQIGAYHDGLDACKILKSDILLHLRVTQEDVWKKMLKFKKITVNMSFYPQIEYPEGTFFLYQ